MCGGVIPPSRSRLVSSVPRRVGRRRGRRSCRDGARCTSSGLSGVTRSMSSPSERTSLPALVDRHAAGAYKKRDSAGAAIGTFIAGNRRVSAAADPCAARLRRRARPGSSATARRHHDEHHGERDRERPVHVPHTRRLRARHLSAATPHDPIDTPSVTMLSWAPFDTSLARRMYPTRPPTPRITMRCASAPT